MTRVRAHRRADGTYVRAHTRRTRPRTNTATTARRNTVRSIPTTPAGTTVRVRSYQRADGTYVRSHGRVLPQGTVAVAGAGLGGLLILLLVLAALSTGGSQAAPGKGSAPSPISVSPAADPATNR